MAVIETQALSKQYKQTLAVDRLSMSIEPGIIYGFLGLNGAGKTTTMRMLLGMIRPTHGIARIFGKNCRTDHSIWSEVGYMVESTYAYPELTVRENLQLFHHYYGIHHKSAIGKIIGLLKLENYQHTPARYLSLGNLQRLGLARALMHQPKVLILDEPVNGLDPSGIVEVRELLKSLADKGTTILISSHLLGEITKLADTIGIIHQGVLIHELMPELLDSRLQKKLIIVTDNHKKTKTALEQHHIEATLNSDSEWEMNINHIHSSAEKIACLLIGQGIGLRKLNPVQEDLEHFFLRIIQEYNR
jgi:ABC-2 type transport system ATP-binding protein